MVTGEEGSDLVVAASTLLVAASGQQLRDEADLETIGAELRLVATRTVHPAGCGLWLASRP